MPGNRPRHAITAEALGRRIVGGALLPGTVLPNAEVLAREYRVSRPALREAIKLLAGKGLLEMAPRRGTVVRPRLAWNRLDVEVIHWETRESPSPKLFCDLFELRRMIEPEAAALAAARASTDGVKAIGKALQLMVDSEHGSPASILADLAFHRAILIHSGNEFLATFSSAIEAYLTATFSAQRRVDGQRDSMLRDHAAVYNAIRDGKPEEARAAAIAMLEPAEHATLAGLQGQTLAIEGDKVGSG